MTFLEQYLTNLGETWRVNPTPHLKVGNTSNGVYVLLQQKNLLNNLTIELDE